MALFIKVAFLLFLAAPETWSARLKMEAVPQGAVSEESRPAAPDAKPAASVQSSEHDEGNEETMVGEIERKGAEVVKGMRNAFQGAKQWVQKKIATKAPDREDGEATSEGEAADKVTEKAAWQSYVPKIEPEKQVSEIKPEKPKTKPAQWDVNGWTVVLFFLLLLVQLYISNLCYDTSAWLLSPIMGYMTQHPDKADNVVANLKPQVASLGIDATPTLWVQFNVGVAIHHGAAAFILFLAMCSGSPTLFRLGISFEIGEDLLHYVQMALSLIYPNLHHAKGPFATLPKVAWVFPVLHHALGLIGGTYAYFYLASWVEVHRLAFVLIIAVLPGLLNKPLEAMADLTKPSTYGKINIAFYIIGMAFTLIMRFCIYFPMSFSLYNRVHAEMGATSARVLGGPLVMFGVFSVVSFLLSVISLVNLYKAQTFEEAVDILRKSSSTLQLHAPHMNAHDACSDHHCKGLHSKFLAATKWEAKTAEGQGDAAAPPNTPVPAEIVN